MNQKQLSLKDGTKITFYEWPVNNAKAHLHIVHGYAEYAGRYDHFAKYLNQQSISVSAYDQRGHGRSEGLRAYIDRFEIYVNDLEEVLTHVNPSAPLFLMGHSMGGLVSVRFALDKNTSDFRGMIVTSALLEIDKDLSPILQWLAPILGFLFPKMPTEKLDKTYLTRSPENLEAYTTDPLVYLGGTRARTGAELLKTIKTSRERFAEIDLPILICHGEADRLTMPGGSRLLAEMSTSKDKTLKIYPGLYHELINEPERDMVMRDFGKWILERATETSK